MLRANSKKICPALKKKLENLDNKIVNSINKFEKGESLAAYRKKITDFISNDLHQFQAEIDELINMFSKLTLNGAPSSPSVESKNE